MDKQVKVRLVMDGGRVVEAQLEGIGAKGKTAMEGLGNASGALRGNLQMASYQVQDFFVQVAAGTDPVRALSMQLPQLLGSLGLIGVLAGTAAAALVPLVGNLLEVGKDSESAEKAIRSLAESTSALNEIAGANLDKLRDKYGKVNAEILVMMTRRFAIEKAEASKAAREAVNAVSTEFEGLSSKIAAYQDYKASFDRLTEQQANGENNAEALMVLQDAMAELEEQTGLTYEQMTLLQDAIADTRAAETFHDQANAVSGLLGLLEQLGLASEPFYQSLVAAEEELRAVNQSSQEAYATVLDLASSAPGSGWMSDAIASVSGLIGKLATAVGLRNALSGTIFEPKGDGPAFERGGRMGSTSAPYVPPDLTLEELFARNAPKGRGGKTGGGGVSEAQKAQNDLMREAQRLYDQTRTDAEKYTEEVSKLDEMLKAGLIDQELYNRGLKQAAERYGEASTAAGFFKSMNIDIKKTLIDIAVDGGDALDSLIDKLKRAALEAMIFGTGPFAKMFGGGSLGSIFPGFLSGALASGGPVERGSAYLVGEQGPEYFIPGANGVIMPMERRLDPAKLGGSRGLDGPSVEAGVKSSLDLFVTVLMDESTGKLGAFVEHRAKNIAEVVVRRDAVAVVSDFQKRKGA